MKWLAVLDQSVELEEHSEFGISEVDPAEKRAVQGVDPDLQGRRREAERLHRHSDHRFAGALRPAVRESQCPSCRRGAPAVPGCVERFGQRGTRHPSPLQGRIGRHHGGCHRLGAGDVHQGAGHRGDPNAGDGDDLARRQDRAVHDPSWRRPATADADSSEVHVLQPWAPKREPEHGRRREVAQDKVRRPDGQGPRAEPMLLFFGQARRDAGIAVGAARQCLPGAVATGSLDLVGRQALGQQRGTEQDGWQGISFVEGISRC